MKGIGTVLHVAGSGRLIVKLSGAASEGDVLCDSKGTKIARIREVIGPVGAPYASAEILTNNIKRHLGTVVGLAQGRSSRR